MIYAMKPPNSSNHPKSCEQEHVFCHAKIEHIYTIFFAHFSFNPSFNQHSKLKCYYALTAYLFGRYSIITTPSLFKTKEKKQ